ncbi:hypothetical protein CLOM_g22458 [Closterium sp. NIES-68]|nr:hypothetical protein CLOM_g22458 [Closterium sp. NIES-68]
MGVAAHSTAQQDRTCPPPSPPFSLLLLPPPGVRSIGGEAKAWLLTAGEESPASPPPLPLLPSQRQLSPLGAAPAVVLACGSGVVSGKSVARQSFLK